MSKRTRNNLGQFVSARSGSASGSALAQFGQESTSTKRPRGVQPNMPNYPGNLGALRSRSQAPPSAGQLKTGYSEGVIDIGSNSTSSLPVQARPWSPECAISAYAPGSLLFIRKDTHQHAAYRSVADLATINWLLRQARSLLGGASTHKDMGAASNGHKLSGFKGERGWNYMGLLRNSYKPPASLLTLMNTDVFGRSKVANIFSRRLQAGDRVGVALLPVDLTKQHSFYGGISGPGSNLNNVALYLQSLEDDGSALRGSSDASSCATRTAKEMMLAPYKANKYKNGAQQYEGKYNVRANGGQAGEYHVWQFLPTVNGELSKHAQEVYFPVPATAPANTPPDIPDFIDHISLGCVSNALFSGKCVERHMLLALHSTDHYTTLPQIEVLIE